eukprot:CAMPEP_0175040762 /NCGR_PEP_ID=MMETSP0052_2-20121109/1468_1 /TAXON_ID=51329 ORGANISM="Polytomella parva, Strain SAG 63-3" /NCGR_SAMPLE_ID=MMETSP0052_2 /ASSEMBLY_ACC=CAM_ASM_000194 /LENGTH=787 /DNA_ID=CAMNT_0016303059 /DNA_START=97 /DNA_END=2457 /DNA_ORIENTATION=-
MQQPIPIPFSSTKTYSRYENALCELLQAMRQIQSNEDQYLSEINQLRANCSTWKAKYEAELVKKRRLLRRLPQPSFSFHRAVQVQEENNPALGTYQDAPDILKHVTCASPATSTSYGHDSESPLNSLNDGPEPLASSKASDVMQKFTTILALLILAPYKTSGSIPKARSSDPLPITPTAAPGGNVRSINGGHTMSRQTPQSSPFSKSYTDLKESAKRKTDTPQGDPLNLASPRGSTPLAHSPPGVLLHATKDSPPGWLESEIQVSSGFGILGPEGASPPLDISPPLTVFSPEGLSSSPSLSPFDPTSNHLPDRPYANGGANGNGGFDSTIYSGNSNYNSSSGNVVSLNMENAASSGSQQRHNPPFMSAPTNTNTNTSISTPTPTSTSTTTLPNNPVLPTGFYPPMALFNASGGGIAGLSATAVMRAPVAQHWPKEGQSQQQIRQSHTRVSPNRGLVPTTFASRAPCAVLSSSPNGSTSPMTGVVSQLLGGGGEGGNVSNDASVISHQEPPPQPSRDLTPPRKREISPTPSPFSTSASSSFISKPLISTISLPLYVSSTSSSSSSSSPSSCSAANKNNNGNSSNTLNHGSATAMAAMTSVAVGLGSSSSSIPLASVVSGSSSTNNYVSAQQSHVSVASTSSSSSSSSSSFVVSSSTSSAAISGAKDFFTPAPTFVSGFDLSGANQGIQNGGSSPISSSTGLNSSSMLLLNANQQQSQQNQNNYHQNNNNALVMTTSTSTLSSNTLTSSSSGWNLHNLAQQAVQIRSPVVNLPNGNGLINISGGGGGGG